MARTAHKSGRPHEDLVSITGQLADGTVTSHLVNWLSPMKERLTVVTGEKGTFVADTLTADLTFYANGTIDTEWDAIAKFRGVSEGDVVRYAIAKPEPLRTEHENFRDAVLGVEGATARIVTMRQGLATVAVAEGALRSAREGVVVTF
jgi:predicted dehydrogenase